MPKTDIPVLSIVGRSKTGKTSLIERLIPLFSSKGIKVSVIKHHHLDFEIDIPGKDTYRFKHAGARTVVISSPKKMAIIKDSECEPTIEEIISKYTADTGFVIVEGYKKANLPKVEVYLKRENMPPVCINDKNLLAIVTDVPYAAHVPVFSRNDIEGITGFICSHFGFRISD